MNWDAIGAIGETVEAMAAVTTKNQSHGMDSANPAVLGRRAEDLGLPPIGCPSTRSGGNR